MARNLIKLGLGAALVSAGLFGVARDAQADDATVSVGSANDRFSEPPPNDPNRQPAPIAPIASEDPRFGADPREPHRGPFRLQLGPQGVTSGKGFGLGVGLAADFGSGSVGGRISASWLRGEGTNSDGTSTPTGDSVGLYTGELTLDAHKRGPIHPILGMGIGVLHVSRTDASGFAGVGTGRLAAEYSLGLDDADVRVGASVTGGLIGPVDSDVKDVRAFALVGLHLAIGF
jgi:hypothetical protein